MRERRGREEREEGRSGEGEWRREWRARWAEMETRGEMDQGLPRLGSWALPRRGLREERRREGGGEVMGGGEKEGGGWGRW